MRRVFAGQPARPSVAAQNQIAAALEKVNRFGAGPDERDPGRVVGKVYNNTAALRRGEIIGVGAPKYTFAADAIDVGPQICVMGETVAAVTHLGRFAIAAEAVGAGKIGNFVFSGLAVAWVEITDETHRFADIKPGAVKLISRPTGAAQILAVAAGTGDRLAWVRVGPPTVGVHQGQLLDALPYGETGYAYKFDGHDGFVTVPVICRLLTAGQQLPDESAVELLPLANKDEWVVIACGSCPEDIPE